MKKHFLLTALLFGLLAAPAVAFDQGVLFEGGVTGALKVYPYEQVSYQCGWDNGITLGVDFRAMQNVMHESKYDVYCYFEPGVTFNFKGAYISGGFLLSEQTKQGDQISGFVRAGYSANPWQWGPGMGGIDVGLEFSGTPYLISDDENPVGQAVAASLLTIFNLVKISAGVSWKLPF